MKKYTLTGTISLLFLLPLLVSAETTATSSASTTPSGVTPSTTATTTVSTSTINSAFTKCQQTAIEKRDASIASARNAYNQTMSQALAVRTAGEKSLVEVTNTEEKKVALKKVVEAYRTSAKTAQATLTSARKATWATFEEDTKACRDSKNAARAKLERMKKEIREERKDDRKEIKKEDKEDKEDRKDSREERKEENATTRESLKDMVKSLQEKFFHN